jgi:HCOMODA/2-hydroxy-3-carboxy-muconic semialdehyde decarboxylase
MLMATGSLLADPRPVMGQRTPASGGAAASKLIEDLVAANRILAHEAIVDGYGHVSARHDRDPNRYLLSRSLAPGLVSSDDLIEYDLDSNPVNAKGRALYSERFIHGEIYKARPDVLAVVHCHTSSLIPFGTSTMALRPVYHLAAFIGDGVPVFDIRDTVGVTDMLVSDSNRGRALARTLGARPVALMRGHGAVVVGSSIPIAVGRGIYLDVNARLQAAAVALGGPIKYLDPQEARKVMEAGENGGYLRPWELWKQQASAR